MRRTLQLLAGATVAALCGVAVDAASNPLFADGATCSTGSANVCMVSETCTDYGWQLNVLQGSLVKTCLAKTVKTYYWSSGGSGESKTYMPAG